MIPSVYNIPSNAGQMSTLSPDVQPPTAQVFDIPSGLGTQDEGLVYQRNRLSQVDFEKLYGLISPTHGVIILAALALLALWWLGVRKS